MRFYDTQTGQVIPSATVRLSLRATGLANDPHYGGQSASRCFRLTKRRVLIVTRPVAAHLLSIFEWRWQKTRPGGGLFGALECLFNLSQFYVSLGTWFVVEAGRKKKLKHGEYQIMKPSIHRR